MSLMQQLTAKVLICAEEKAPTTSPWRLLTCSGHHVQACILRNHPRVTWQSFMRGSLTGSLNSPTAGWLLVRWPPAELLQLSCRGGDLERGVVTTGL